METNKLWNKGYGFNNPNPDRISKGLRPLDFDGKESKDPSSPFEPIEGW
jgi:hypothetical protein